MTRLADLFRAGQILGRAYQPYESHVPYLLQFMIDYNLYGCGTVRSASVDFRIPLPPRRAKDIRSSSFDTSLASTRSLHGHSYLSNANIPSSRVLGDDFLKRSHSPLEIDLAAGTLLNRQALNERPIHHDIKTENQYAPDNDQRVLPSLTELWREDTRRREALGLTPSKSQIPKSNVRQRSNVWSNEEELKNSLQKVVRQHEQLMLQNLGEEHKLLDLAMEKLPTSFSSIQAFCNKQSTIMVSYRTSRSSPIDAAKITIGLKSVDSTHSKQPDFLHSTEKPRISESADGLTEMSTNSQPKLRESESVDSPPLRKSVVKLQYRLSKIANYLNRPIRLRGGADSEDETNEVKKLFKYHVPPPSVAALNPQRQTFVNSDFPEPFYSDSRDVPALARDYAANGMMPKSRHHVHLPTFFDDEIPNRDESSLVDKLIYTFESPPPPRQKLERSWETKAVNGTSVARTTEIGIPTQVPIAAANSSQARKISEADVPLSVLSIEIHARCQGTLLPNPTSDPIIGIFWAYQDFGLSDQPSAGCMLSTQHLQHHAGFLNITDYVVTIYDTEIELVHAFIDLVREKDPDAVLSFEMQNSSIGFIEERTKTAFSFSAEAELGRLIAAEKDDPGYSDRWGETHATSVKISGRHVLNLWRVMRSEMNLLQYTLENVAFHQLKIRIPKYNHFDLQRWLASNSAAQQQRVLRYYMHRTKLNLDIIESQGLLSRVSEQARLLGIDFYSVFSRGSQFKVESLMFRIAKPECFMMMSPSKKQVAQQNALECLPLVMEPQSHFYHDPILVLDFQSLYPSIMIAYNFCYSTCLGKLGYAGLETKLGVTRYAPESSLITEVEKNIEVAPNGVLYVQDQRRKSLLAKMLHDLLETRAMVKEGMKLCKTDKAAQKLMHNRQLALKLIANVTYGYTSASFSGRMPCADIADSIVQTGRETLEKAIEFIHSHSEWNAEVVYGDTDSLFVKLPRRTKDEAFVIGNQMANEITKLSPSPIKLKFEKVYLPCVLLAKKRYVGFKYESAQDKEPVFDAKGIETVRRDGTPAEQKIEENALKIMFRTGDLSAVKDYFQQECWKIMTGRCSLHDFCFAKEVKLGTYSTKGVPPPGAVISAKSIAADPRSEPQYGERVSYLVISGASRSRLTDRCVPPEELLLNPDLRLDVEYYITKNIVPPLDRIFSLMGVNVRSWYDEMPRSLKLINKAKASAASRPTSMIETFLTSSHCPVCERELARPGICQACLSRPDNTIYDVAQASRLAEKTHLNVLRVCASCCRVPMHSEIACMSKDCPIYYKRVKSGREVNINMVNELEPILKLSQERD